MVTEVSKLFFSARAESGGRTGISFHEETKMRRLVPLEEALRILKIHEGKLIEPDDRVDAFPSVLDVLNAVRNLPKNPSREILIRLERISKLSTDPEVRIEIMTKLAELELEK